MGHGFRREDWLVLSAALLEQAGAADARPVATAFGMRYVVDAPIAAPDGRRPWVRSIWEVKDGLPPRLVSAYPTEPVSDDR